MLEEERDTLKQSNMDLIKEKRELQNRIAELEVQKSVADQNAEQYEA